MSRRRVLVSCLVVGLAGLAVGMVSGWFSDSATIHHEIQASDAFEDDESAKIWVCKLVGPPESPVVAPGRNPILVSVASVVAEEAFSDGHPSYVVDNGDVECVVPTLRPETSSELLEPAPDPTTSTTLATTTTTTTVAAVSTTTTTASTSTTTSTTTATTLPVDTTTTTGS